MSTVVVKISDLFLVEVLAQLEHLVLGDEAIVILVEHLERPLGPLLRRLRLRLPLGRLAHELLAAYEPSVWGTG